VKVASAPEIEFPDEDPVTQPEPPRIHCRRLRVGPESIDALDHVNNREYLRWMEEAAVEHSTLRGWPLDRYLALGSSWMAMSHFLEYLRPAFLDDEVTVYTWIGDWDARTSRRRYEVVRDRDRKALARGETRWAFVELASGRACDIAAGVRADFVVVPDEDPELHALGLARRRRTSDRRVVG
jgi:acyl-CoA thioester hydrolase